MPNTDQPQIAPSTIALLQRFFPTWRGDASEPTIPTPAPTRPAPAAAELEMA